MKVAVVQMTKRQLDFNAALRSSMSTINMLKPQDRWKTLRGRAYDLLVQLPDYAQEFKKERTPSLKAIMEEMSSQVGNILEECQFNALAHTLKLLKNLIKTSKSVILVKEMFLC